MSASKPRRRLAVCACALVALGATGAAVADSRANDNSPVARNSAAAPLYRSATGQHGGSALHLPAVQTNMERVGRVKLTDQIDGIADVAVFKNFAYVNAWDGECDDPNNAENNRGGVHIVDISNPAAPVKTGFVPAPPNSYHGEGAHVITVDTPAFKGDLLAVNNESCGNLRSADPNRGAGGMNLIDVTDPRNPKTLAVGVGDPGATESGGQLQKSNSSHSVFLWDAGDKAYAVFVDNNEQAGKDTDIMDVTDPTKPVLLAEHDLDQLFASSNVSTGMGRGNQAFLHDAVVKRSGDKFLMIASYWDAGYIVADVTDPANPKYVSDSDFAGQDPLVAGIAPPEGNAHYAEFSHDDKYILAADEDFAPYRAGKFTVDGVEFPASEVSGGLSAASLPDVTLNGPVVYGGYGCNESTAIPQRDSFNLNLQPGEEAIIVLQRGPAYDSDEDYDADNDIANDSDDACFPGEKGANADEAGWDAMVLINRHAPGMTGATDSATCGSGGYDRPVVTICTTHTAGHAMFNDAPEYGTPYDDDQEMAAIGTVGDRIRAESVFDGWGYTHLYENTAGKLKRVDSWAIEEALDDRFAFGFGDLSVHEWAADPTEDVAYAAYYAGGVRTVQYGPDGIEETGKFIDDGGNNIWGIEQFSTRSERLLAASDRDYGLYLLRYTGPGAAKAPECDDRTYGTGANQPVTIDLVCRDANGNTLTLNILNGPANGTLSAISGGKVVYTPKSGFNGTDSFTYEAFDGALKSNVAKITLLVGRCANRIDGTSAADVIVGTLAGDAIFGGIGNDVINGAQGADCLYGENGDDQLTGGAGADSLTGQAGNDRLFGDSENDSLRGGIGNDNIRGESGNDSVRGDDGNDFVAGGSNNDVVYGGNGRDSVRGEDGNDRLYGGNGNDTIDAGKGTNRVSGGAGNDKILAVNGRRDRINCGSGRDNVRADSTDSVASNCETVRRTRRTR